MDMGEALSGAREAMTVRRVFGEPYEKDGAVIVPAAAVRGGAGGGGGSMPEGETGSGGGFGLSARPVGAYVFRDGEATWVPAVDVTHIAVVGNLVGLALGFMLWRLLRYRAKHR